MKRIINLILSAFLILPVCAQPQDMKKQLDNYFRNYRAFGQLIRTSSKLQDIKVNDTLRTIEVIADSHFGEQVFTPKSAEDIYEAVGKIVSPLYKHYELTVKTLDFTAPEYVYIEGVDFRNRVLYCYTFVEDMNDILETDSFSILGYPFTGSIKS